MSNKSSPRCPRCGAALPGSALAGLCPNCLMALNLAPETVLTGADASVLSSAVPPPLSPSELAPHFPQLEILECLGRGGMGVVYKARQKSLNRLVALKLLAPERVSDAKFARRFTHEAQALATLNHPSIVTIYDFGQAGGFYFLLMEFVDGVNLRQAMKAGRFTPEQALAVVPPVCEALQYAHEHGIVHRDIKPENLLLDREGRVKIADFGIAKLLHAADPDVGLADSQPAGTPQYMAPEQREPHRTDHRADIYSLGVVLYELLTGELPADKLQPPSRKVQIDVRLDQIVLRALEKTPELRYQTAGEFRTQVETIAAATPPPSEPRRDGSPLTWNAGALIGATIGIASWMPMTAITSRWSGAGVGLSYLTTLSVVVAALLVWRLRERIPAIWGYMTLLATGFLSSLGCLLLAESLGLTLRKSWPGSDAISPGQVAWSLAIYPVLAAGLLARARRRKSTDADGHAPYVLFALLYAGLVAGLMASVSSLPDRVACHFGFEGRANGWMDRTHYLLLIAAMPMLLAVVFAAVAHQVRSGSASLINIPRRDFWLAPERRAITARLVRNRLAWLLCLFTLLFGGLHVLTVMANQQRPPQVPMGGLLLLVIAFLTALIVWLALLLMRFAETGDEQGGAASPGAPAAPKSRLAPEAPANSNRTAQRRTPARIALWIVAGLFSMLGIFVFNRHVWLSQERQNRLKSELALRATLENTSPATNHTEAQLAESAQGSSDDAMTIRVYPDGAIFSAGEKLTLEELKTAATTENRLRSLVISADESVPLAQVTALAGALRASGLDNFSFADGRPGDGRFRVANRTGKYALGSGRDLYLCRPGERPHWFTVRWPAVDGQPRPQWSIHPKVTAATRGQWAVVWEPGAEVLWWVDDVDVGRLRLTNPGEVLVTRESRTADFPPAFGLPEEVKAAFALLGFNLGPGHASSLGNLFRELAEAAQRPDQANPYPTARHFLADHGRTLAIPVKLQSLLQADDSKLTSEQRAAKSAAEVTLLEKMAGLARAAKQFELQLKSSPEQARWFQQMPVPLVGEELEGDGAKRSFQFGFGVKTR